MSKKLEILKNVKQAIEEKGYTREKYIDLQTGTCCVVGYIARFAGVKDEIMLALPDHAGDLDIKSLFYEWEDTQVSITKEILNDFLNPMLRVGFTKYRLCKLQDINDNYSRGELLEELAKMIEKEAAANE